MPFVNIKVLKGILDLEQRKEVARRIPDLIEEIKGVEGFRKNVWVVIEEVKDFWGSGGDIVTREDVEAALREKTS